MRIQTITSDGEFLLPSKPDFKEYMLKERRKAEAGTLGKMAVLELFAGIGAPHSALSRSHPGKFAVLDVVEIWSKAVESYNLLYGTNYDTQDVRTWFWEFDIRFDLVFHGSPCQDFSQAGKNKGGVKGSGTRSATLWETCDIVSKRLKPKLRPKCIIWENVKGALSGSNRSVFDGYIEELKSLGYTTTYQILNAKEFGIPQNRNRVFVISILNEFADEFKDFSFEKLIKREYKPAKYYLETEVDSKYFISNSAPSMVKAVQLGKIKLIDGIVQTVTTRQDRWNSAGVVPLAIETKSFKNFVTLPDGNGELINGTYNRVWDTNKEMNTISASVPSKIIVPITGYVTQDKFHSTDKEIPTIGTGPALRPNIIVPITNYDQENRLHVPEGALPTIGAGKAQRPHILVPVNELPVKVKVPIHNFNHQNDIVNANADTIPTIGTRDAMRPRMFIPVEGDGSKQKGKVRAFINENGEYVVDGIIPGAAIFNVRGRLCHARRITPRESFRYMDFKDYQYDRLQNMSENNLYKMAGNSIVVSVLAELFDKLFYGWKNKEVQV